MSNQIDHRVTPNKRNTRRKERVRQPSSCGGEGHNGAIGLSKWKKLSRRSERRAAGKKVPSIKKYKKKNVRVQANFDHPIAKVFVPRPRIDNDAYDFEA